MDLDREISKLMGWESIDCEGSTLWGVWDGDLFRAQCSIAKDASPDIMHVFEAAIKHIAALEAALKDCINYVDVDNLTMQHKERAWKTVLAGGKWRPGNVEVV